MGRPEIFIEHRNGEKVQKHLRVKPEKADLFLIGSSKEADLRIRGEKISGCHAALRFRAPHWYICNLSEDGETRVGDETLVERRIDGRLEVEIGTHRLTLFARERKETLFQQGGPEGDHGLHQVVVRSKGHVVETHVLKAAEPYKFRVGIEKRELPAPKSGEWVTTEIGTRSIQQRLVASQELAVADKFEIDRDLKKPLLVSLLVMMFLMTTAILMSRKQPTTVAEAPLTKKSMEMIFDAKTIKKKKAEVQKVAAAKAKQGGTGNAKAAEAKSSLPEESQAPKVSAKTTAALTSLRQSGLSSLIGKIAKRANKQGVLVAATGVSPDTKGSGRAFFSVGTSTGTGGGSASKEGSTYRLGGVGTRGKAGGSGAFRDGTALAGGSVGAGDVALVDEETVVEGGLDRDAIAEVIKRNLGQIRYCYERQLSSNKDLYGKIQVKFTIGASGEVGDPRIDNTTMKNAMVEGCILRRLAGWKFPLPKGGTMVKVSYPFLFKALD